MLHDPIYMKYENSEGNLVHMQVRWDRTHTFLKKGKFLNGMTVTEM